MSRLPFKTPNLGASLIQSGFSFASFSENLPYPSFNALGAPSDDQTVADGYVRRHNPVANWINFAAYGTTVAGDKQRFLLPLSANLGMENTVDPDGTKFPGFGVDENGGTVPFDELPVVSLVVPDDQHNSHTGSLAACDAWVEKHIKAYADWAAQNDSLLIVTPDECGHTDRSNGMSNFGLDKIMKDLPGRGGGYYFGRANMPTFLFGPSDRVKVGLFDTEVDHLNVLATVLDMYGALESFKEDFEATWSSAIHPINEKWVAGDDPVRKRELIAQIKNLSPITSVFL
ncbi:alkaline phosphatase family protein [Achromobacter aegrifaciens]|uniref:Phosphoesterase family n=1 Tax=Achromobacter aegrifaciens TaxID=1287736 RepID=A0AAD2KLV8_ACHAE|nr:alkaline phosphatase family protein [Achromobacter aegrifaciens]CUJ69120.1 Phosphoesterase family [Achromobacter aegrifaciens]